MQSQESKTFAFTISRNNDKFAKTVESNILLRCLFIEAQSQSFAIDYGRTVTKNIIND